MTAFSDYPIPDHYPNYMHNSKMMEYLRMYAKHFGLMKHIQFQTKVCTVRKRPDFSSSGQWDVVVEADGKQKAYIFDGVMVCSGHYNEKYLPLQDFAGITQFQGSYIHSWEYKNPDSFMGKRVVVIGIGNSGADVAGEISHVAEQVFLSTRRGTWIWNRVWDNGDPLDTTLFTRYNRIMGRLYPTFLINRWAENKLNARFNHANYGLQAKHRFLSHQSIFSDDLPNRIITGKVVIKTNVKEFTSTSAIFEDGTEEPVDVVVFATGYTLSFPFLDDNSEILDSKNTMFKFVFPPQLEKPTLAFIGILQPVGATIPTSELQSRWVVRVFTGLKKLPSQSDMMAAINRRKQKMQKELVESPRGIHRVQYIDYMDEIASEIGRPRECRRGKQCSRVGATAGAAGTASESRVHEPVIMSRYGRYGRETKVYVGNLGSGAGKGELERAFSYYGPLRTVWIVRNPPGFAFVEFEDPTDAEDAVQGLDGKVICGSRVRVELSTGMPRRSRFDRPPARRPFDPNDRCYECGEKGRIPELESSFTVQMRAVGTVELQVTHYSMDIYDEKFLVSASVSAIAAITISKTAVVNDPDFIR
ncbi:Dimethylaniline monooxygenase [N-oxide-forming] 5 [Microtus ochrogaster]|uniref:Flavin-containing monooxygenase n=1 Tax=Microtus ochrogaster TaxID=79684 RepID=A0A8J6G191_MICOH|nr:Dimethylaniline monooxygenase [N-oxide-forming] 5 [Microtus ochrogaster]